MRYLEMTAGVVLVVAALGGRPARASDQTLPANRLLVLDLPGYGQLLHVSRHENLGVHVPTPGGPDDPTRVGATVTIYNPDSCESATFDMPASNWRLSHGERAIGFRFVNRNAPAAPSAVQLAEIRIDRLKVHARSSGITLDESSQRSLGLVLTMGSQRYCTLFGGRITRDQPGMFAGRLAPAPASCPPSSCSASVTASVSADD
jgi:hypothetical protein